MGDLKLPLRVSRGYRAGFRVWDADDQPVKITEHRAELIVAALETDAERDSLSPAVCRAMARFYTGLADAKEKETTEALEALCES